MALCIAHLGSTSLETRRDIACSRLAPFFDRLAEFPIVKTVNKPTYENKIEIDEKKAPTIEIWHNIPTFPSWLNLKRA